MLCWHFKVCLVIHDSAPTGAGNACSIDSHSEMLGTCYVLCCTTICFHVLCCCCDAAVLCRTVPCCAVLSRAVLCCLMPCNATQSPRRQLHNEFFIVLGDKQSVISCCDVCRRCSGLFCMRSWTSAGRLGTRSPQSVSSWCRACCRGTPHTAPLLPKPSSTRKATALVLLSTIFSTPRSHRHCSSKANWQ